jgi:hypothetical protein
MVKILQNLGIQHSTCSVSGCLSCGINFIHGEPLVAHTTFRIRDAIVCTFFYLQCVDSRKEEKQESTREHDKMERLREEEKDE